MAKKQEKDPMTEDMLKSLVLSKDAIKLGADKNAPQKYQEALDFVDMAISRLKKKK